MPTSDLYLTTSLPYVNGAPHLGHALEFVQADALARHARSRGRAVRFLTGTDDNALKNAQAALAAGLPVGEFVSRNGCAFDALAHALAVSVDDVIHTSTDPRHRPAVERVWRSVAASGDLYRRAYEGAYCAGCEGFVGPDDLDAEGRCPEHGVAPQIVREENWFFRISRYERAIRDAIISGRLRIEPEVRAAEVIALLERGLHDISVSRARERAHGWGIPVPDDPSQVVYVWFDALVNYISALGYGSDDPAYARWWTGTGERAHVIGKGITRFHAVYWAAILLSAGIPLPDVLWVHDYVTVDTRKIGKSLGNAVDPAALADRYGADALRWWLLREVPRVGETDFTEARLVDAANRDLANGVGNLVQRTTTLVARACEGAFPAAEPARGCVAAGPGAEELRGTVAALPRRVDAALGRFDHRAATGAIVDLVRHANRFAEETRPWELARAPGRDRDRLLGVLQVLFEAARAVGTELEPFVPQLAAEVRARVAGCPVVAGPPLYPRLTQP
jgi:methionyl-tRNA synthetase